MASRKNTRRRRTGGREFIGNCEAAECPKEGYRKVFIPDSGREHVLCGQHALAVEFQMTRNRAAAATEERKRTEERLGIR